VIARAQESSTSSVLYANASTQEAAREEFYESLTGRWTAPSGITNGFQRMSAEKLNSIGAGAIVEAGLVNQSHMEFLYENSYYPGGPSFFSSATNPTDSQAYYFPQSNESYFSLTAQTTVALSRGSVSLKSMSVYDDPDIDPNYYADPTDRAIAINAFRDLRKLLAHPALSRFTIGPHNGEVLPGLDNVPEDADDDTIFQFIKANTIPNWHASGTCQMLPEADGGVVDARLRVYGVQGLRVIDVSIMPVLPDVNVGGPVYMVAERGAELVKEDYGVSSQ
jgi:choline dehydrogenase